MSCGAENRSEIAVKDELLRLRVEWQAEKGVWTMRDGEEIRLEDMTTCHIINAKRMLEKKNDCDFWTPWIVRFERELKRREAPDIRLAERYITKEDALNTMREIKDYLTSGNPIWKTGYIGEVCDMAIEALEKSAEPDMGGKEDEQCVCKKD